MTCLSNCDECKHCKGLHPDTKVMICDAFPNGIPVDYALGVINVKEITECANGYKFEKANHPE